MRSFELFRQSLLIGLKHLLAYRLSAILTLLFGTLLLSGEVVVIDIYYGFDHLIGDWSQGDFLILLGSLNLMAALYTFLFEIAHDEMQAKIRMGFLDFDLVRPMDTQLLASLSRVDYAGLLSIPLPIGVLIRGFYLNHEVPTWPQLLLYVPLILLGTLALYLMHQMSVTFSFWLTESRGLAAASDQLVRLASRPMHLYPRLIRFGLIYLGPVVFCSNYSVLLFRGSLSFFSLAEATVSVVLLGVLSRILWLRGLARYASASS